MTPSGSAVVRITTLIARPGEREHLLVAAWENASAAARQPGCRSAEVAEDPADPMRVLVISRWDSEREAQAFLVWHKTLAHASLKAFTAEPVASVHYRVDAAAALAVHSEQ
ncbi:antibiotic biosynthesis monooxygenase family protein [Microbacterium terrisoli]|jgi:quinol monooxygenase YgiN|uniref:antibiotic biosynthesis monooxygenase family protein n=1 Tax=Microbacterium terrisoli TaxID=3242192 RepID=UPI002804A20D|nr:antibiotic biosynthesis monooxygenase family protein [Microbacterium protaetiae]